MEMTIRAINQWSGRNLNALCLACALLVPRLSDAADELAYAYVRTLVSRGNGPNREAVAEISESGLLTRSDGEKDKFRLYQDSVLTSFCGKSNSDDVPPQRQMIGSSLTVNTRDGYELGLKPEGGIRVNARAPYLLPMWELLSRTPQKQQLPQGSDARLVSIDGTVHEFDMRIVWSMSKKVESDSDFTGPVVGQSEHADVIVGGTVSRTVDSSSVGVQKSTYEIIISVEREAYLRSVKKNEGLPDPTQFLGDASAVVTLDEVTFEKVGKDGKINLPVSTPVQNFARDLKATGKRPY